MKNAYALMGKHRFGLNTPNPPDARTSSTFANDLEEYAAAFFLLAGSLKDAVNVCFDRMNDMQLAIAIARIHGGDESPVLKSLLEHRVLPLAVSEGNRWLATWAFWMLHKKDMAVRSLLVSPLPPPSLTHSNGE